jgi:hypothetical protein
MPLPLRGRGVVNRSDLAQGIINPIRRRSGFKRKGAAIQAGRTALAPPNTPKKKKEKKIERPAGAVVYYSMNNLRGRLGSTRQVRGLGCDTDSSIFSKRFDARLHGAGINDEEKAGQRSNTDECHIGRQRFGLSLRTVGATSWSGGKPSHRAAAWRGRWRNHGNPCAVKGMHTRSQQLYFGGGETRHANAETSLTFGEISEVRQPASFSL